jgi:hypothetical protein
MLGRIETLNHRRRLKAIKTTESLYSVDEVRKSKFNKSISKSIRRSIGRHPYIGDVNP